MECAVDVLEPIIAASRSAFLYDLPTLLATHRGQWVAYRNDERIGVDPRIAVAPASETSPGSARAGWLRVHGISPQIQRIPLRDAYLWIYPKLPGSQAPQMNVMPTPLDLSDGIAITPTSQLPGYP